MNKNEEYIDVNDKINGRDFYITEENFRQKRFGTLKDNKNDKNRQMTAELIARSKTFSHRSNNSKDEHINHYIINLMSENSKKKKTISEHKKEYKNPSKGKPFRSSINSGYKNLISSISENSIFNLNSPNSIKKIPQKKIEFYINNNKKNENLNLKDNTITTSK